MRGGVKGGGRIFYGIVWALFLESAEPLNSKLDFSGSLTSAYSEWEEYGKLGRHAHSFATDMRALHQQWLLRA
jgi:hypothetical protein